MREYQWLALLLLLSAVSAYADEDLLRHWTYDKNQPLETSQVGVQEREGIKIYDIKYRSPVADRGSAVGPNGGIVTSYLVVPSGKGPFPAVIYGHWCMPGSEKKNSNEFFDEEIVLAHSGVLSLLPDHVTVHPGFVEENAPMSEQQIAVAIQQDINLRRGADLLIARKDVDPKRIAYVGHSCDATAGGFLSGIDKRFKAFVIMAGDLSIEVDKTTKEFQEYRQKVGPEKLDAFMTKFAWMDAGKYVSHAAPAAMFVQYATDEPFLKAETAKRQFQIVSEPKRLKIYAAPPALK